MKTFKVAMAGTVASLATMIALPGGSGAAQAATSPTTTAAASPTITAGAVARTAPNARPGNSPAAMTWPKATTQGIKGAWIYDYKKPQTTKHVRSYGKVQMCFNVTGDHLYQGYRLAFTRRTGGVFAHYVDMWQRKYWGPKHKTCTGWLNGHHDKVWAEIYPIKSPIAHAKAHIWIYNP
ncbi:hypothetical protein J4573_49390 [Actinomadura barringtoniae]|uniref:Uncharacterized protein n=1 Tax=Actinomadura barringtoniae TaxID=1427535 RepID=A0A939PRZ9_9ACTN|nr:hypothetical protein [Actinomadura barringtoniae]MBO2455178.1 hypothetical protein [Actinomadura barringtoniae]